MTNTIKFEYTNHKGTISIREATPLGTPPRFMATQHHPEEQWILSMYDVDKEAVRHFAMKDMNFILGDTGE